MSQELLDSQVARIFLKLIHESKQMNVKRINSTMLFRALMLAEDSPIYEALLLQMEEENYFPFSEMIEATFCNDTKNKASKEENENKQETPSISMAFELPEEVLSVDLYFDDDLQDVF